MKKISKRSVTRIICLSIFLVSISFVGCAAHKNADVKEQTTPGGTTWNYDKIRQVREDEAATAPVNAPLPPEAKLKDECDVMKEAAVKLGKRSGCKKLDPRLGFGENAFCCPRMELTPSNK